jgi:hypothetical protein
MSVQTFYRLTLWLPLVVPSLVALAVHGAGVPSVFPFGLLLASLLYGGLPYAVVAIVGTLWIGSRREHDIRRQALRTPLWMIAAYIPIPALIGLRSGNAGMAVAVFVLGAVVILGLGYAYVFAVFGMRKVFFGGYQP